MPPSAIAVCTYYASNPQIFLSDAPSLCLNYPGLTLQTHTHTHTHTHTNSISIKMS